METQELLQDENGCQPLSACWDLPVWGESKEKYLWENEVNTNMLTDGKPQLFWLPWCTHKLSALSVTACTSLHSPWALWDKFESTSVVNVGNVGCQIIRTILQIEASKSWRSALDMRMMGQEEWKEMKKAVLIIMMMIVCVSARQALSHQGLTEAGQWI